MSNYGPEERKGEFAKVCPVCEQSFSTNHERQVYCSNNCKRKAHNRRYYGAHKAQVVAHVVTARRRKKESYDADTRGT